MRYNSITIGSFTATANDADLGSGGNNLLRLEGLESPERRISKFDLPSAHGAFVSNALFGGRPVVVRVEIIGSSEANYASRFATLSNELDLTASSDSYVTMTIVDANGDSYFVTGYASKLSEGNTFGRRAFDEFLFELFCPDYRIFSSTKKTLNLLLEDTSGGLTIPTAIPISFGSGIGGSATATNSGNAPTHPTIRLKGPLTNPTIANVTTDKRFKYESTIANGRYIDIDMQNRTVVDDNGSNVLPNASASIRDFWELAPGDNEITFVHEGTYNAVALATLTWYDAHIGI